MPVPSRSGTSNKLRNCTRMIFLSDRQQSSYLSTAFPRGRKSSAGACSDEAAFCRTHSALSTDCKERCSENSGILTSPFFSDSARKFGGYSSESALNTKTLWARSSPEYLHSNITEIHKVLFCISKGHKPVPQLRNRGHKRSKEFTEFFQGAVKVIKWYL